MAAAIDWTEAMDNRLIHLIQAGQSWDAVSLEMRIGRSSVIERARRLGVAVGEKPVVPRPHDGCGQIRNDDDGPLAAGHPTTWGAIAALTTSIDPEWPG